MDGKIIEIINLMSEEDRELYKHDVLCFGQGYIKIDNSDNKQKVTRIPIEEIIK